MKFIDVFAGIGGFRMALEEFGHECLYTVEYDKKAQVIHEAIWGKSDNFWYDDVRNLDVDKLPDFDILCGGFPCAKFSIAGDRQGFESDDPRATLFFELMRIAETKKPKYLLFENVKGLMNHDEGRSFRTIICKMDELGYNVEWQVINAKDFGGHAIRERVFIVGHLRGECTEKVFPITKGSRSLHSTSQIFQFRRGYFRIFDGYSPTLTASMGTGGNNVPFIKQDGGLRKLTPKEILRLQGIDDKYIDRMLASGMPDSALYERAGRTVFIPIVKEIAKKLN